MTWITLSMAAAFIWALTNIIDKYVLEKLVRKAILPLIALGFVGFITGILVLITQNIEPLSFQNTIWAILAGAAYIGMSVCYFYAVQSEEVSKVIPLFFLAPLFIL